MSGAAIRLIVNADGLGASDDITRGILRAHHEGVVTSASIWGTCADLSVCKQQLQDAPELGLGVHIVLVASAPVSPPCDIASLVNEAGQLFDTPAELFTRWVRGKIQPAHIETEIRAQTRRLLDAGVSLDHMDTYLQLGFLPVISEAMERVAQQLRIRTIRSAMEGPSLAWFTDAQKGLPLAMMGALAYLSRRRLGAIRHGAQSWGFAESGNLGRMRLLEVLGRMGPGVHELICHPGETPTETLTLSGQRRVFERRLELETLCDPQVRVWLRQRQIDLCRFKDVF